VKLFGFYFKYCPHALPYCVERYTKEVKRLLQVLNKQLSHTKPYIAGGALTYYPRVNDLSSIFLCSVGRPVLDRGHLRVALGVRIARELRQRD
jgi:hypothetical protein